MKKSISAIFDSRDAAELALISLHRDNIPILHHNTQKVQNYKHEHDIFYMAPIYSAHRADPNNHSVAPLPLLTSSVNPTSEHLFNDVVSNDVRLDVEVPTNFINRTRSKLISHHGHNITEQTLF